MAKIARPDMLDRAKPFAEIHPPAQGQNGAAHYFQNERYYGGRGERIYWHGETMPSPEELKRQREAVLAAGDKGEPEEFERIQKTGAEQVTVNPHSPLAKTLARQQKMADREDLRKAVEREKSEPAKRRALKAHDAMIQQREIEKIEVNLTAWAKGEQKVVFSKVADAVRKIYGVQVFERSQAVDLLIQKGVVGASEVQGAGSRRRAA